MIKYSRIFIGFSIFLVILIAFECAKTPTPALEPRMTFGSDEAKWVGNTMEKMTLEEKVGQLIACRYTGRFVNQDSEYVNDLKTLVVEQKIGGLILFAGDVYETAHLTNILQEKAKIPLLIASDLERGLGNQIDGATLFPPVMSLGAADSEELAYRMGKITALEARAIGIHMTYAPVVDVNINPDNPIINVRSFGEDPEQVGRLAVPFIKGCQENGLIATAKHFPGHGDTAEDSHTVLPTVKGDRERLDRVEIYPFKIAVESGVQAIMAAHLSLPALDPTPNVPSSLYKPILTDLLRDELGFDGIIVTDAMGMGGVTTLYEPEEAALKAIKAGIDMILLPPKPKEVIAALVQAVRSGEISEKRIDVSVKRILEAKARLGLYKQKLVELELLDMRIAPRAHLRQAEVTFEKSMTLVKNEDAVVPLSGERQSIAVLALSSDPGGFFAGRTFVREMKKRGSQVFEFHAEATTGQDYLDLALMKARAADVLVFALFSRLRSNKGSVGLEMNHVHLVREAAKLSKGVVVISFGSPYFLRHFPEVDAYMCAYRYADEAQIAAAKALFGEIDIQGKLPVSIPDIYPVGHGLTIPKRIQ
ncbi:MAG: glycoside hydrolase family 3 N-terminal domain-containing protein [Candidatus Aminicenantaceae bacterium]